MGYPAIDRGILVSEEGKVHLLDFGIAKLSPKVRRRRPSSLGLAVAP